MNNSGATSNVGKVGNVASNVNSVLEEKWKIIVLIGVVVLAFIAVIVYISFSMKASNLKGKVLMKTPVKLDEQQVSTVIDAGDIPKSVVGREYSYSFWMYLDSFNQSNDKPQMVMYRGSQNSLSDANPVVMMDGNTNKLYFVFKTQGSSLSAVSPFIKYDTDLSNILKRSYFMNKDLTMTTPDINKHVIMSIDYIPLQRWVNIVIVVDNKLITIFMDGEIYSVKSVDEYKSTKTPELDSRGNKIDYNLILEKTEGNIYLGRYNKSPTPPAFMSKLEFYNYAISLTDVRRIYINGPFSKNFLNMLGVAAYGVRSPIYKIDEYQGTK